MLDTGRSGRSGEEKYLLFLRVIESIFLGRLAHGPVTISTELSGFILDPLSECLYMNVSDLRYYRAGSNFTSR